MIKRAERENTRKKRKKKKCTERRREEKRRGSDFQEETHLDAGQWDVSGLQISGYTLPWPIKILCTLIDADSLTRGW